MITSYRVVSGEIIVQQQLRSELLTALVRGMGQVDSLRINKTLFELSSPST